MTVVQSSVPPPEHGAFTATEEARWVAWKARGAHEDMLVRRRMRVVLPMMAVAAAAIFYAAMIR